MNTICWQDVAEACNLLAIILTLDSGKARATLLPGVSTNRGNVNLGLTMLEKE